jgi:hypothetical protein
MKLKAIALAVHNTFYHAVNDFNKDNPRVQVMATIPAARVDGDNPAEPDPYIVGMSTRWAMVKALLGGTRAMRDAGERYLPKHPAETISNYNYRLKVSTLFNGFENTVDQMASKPFSKPVTFKEDAPPELEEWCKNIDLEGRNIGQFGNFVFTQALAYGIHFIISDFPSAPVGETLADERAAGRRPYLCSLAAPAVIGWRTTRVNGVQVLTHFRYWHIEERPVGAFGLQEVKQIVAWDRTDDGAVFVTVYEQPRPGASFAPIGPSKFVTIDEIPIEAVYTSQEGFFMSGIPLEDVAYLNIEHWQNTSDQSNIMHVARVPILFAAGLGDDETIVVGAQNAVKADSPDATLTFVEHTGKSIEAGRQHLKDIEDRMNALGTLLLLQRKTGDVTATEKSLDATKAKCLLGAMVESLEKALNHALQRCGKYVNLEIPEDAVQLFKDFAISGLGAADLDTLLKMRADGSLSKQTLFKEAQRRGLVLDTHDWEEEKVLIEEDLQAGLALFDMTGGGIDPITGKPIPKPGEEEDDEATGQPGGKPPGAPSNGPAK